MRPKQLNRSPIATILNVTLALALILVTMFGAGTELVFAEDQPDGSVIVSPQTTNGVWGPGTITATADVVINAGVVISIAPNTTIRVADGVGFTVNGDLHSDGPVTFTAISATPGAWEGITYANGSTGYLNQATNMPNTLLRWTHLTPSASPTAPYAIIDTPRQPTTMPLVRA